MLFYALMSPAVTILVIYILAWWRWGTPARTTEPPPPA